MTVTRSKLRQGRQIKSLHRATVESLEVRRLLAAVSWTGAVSSFWEEAANWSSGAVPTAVDDVTIGTGSRTAVIRSGDQYVRSVTAASGTFLSITGGSLQVTADSNINGNFELRTGKLAALNAPIYLRNSSTWHSGTIETTGLGSVASSYTLSLQGTDDKHLNGTLVNNSVVYHNAGDLRMASGAKVITNNTYAIQLFPGPYAPGGLIGEVGAAIKPEFQITQNGSLQTTGDRVIDSGVDFSNLGRVIAANGELQIQDADIPQISASGVVSAGSWSVDNATLALPNVPSLTEIGPNAYVQITGTGSIPKVQTISVNNGYLTMARYGQLSLPGDLTNNGRIFLLSEVGLSVAGDFTNAAGSVLHFDRQTGYAQGELNVAGQVTLGGTLNGFDAYGAAPNVGDTYRLIDNAGSDAIVGTFAGLPEGAIVSSAHPNLQYRVSYVGGDGNDLTVTAQTPNRVPTANAGGPYNVLEGGTVQLSSATSSDSDGTITGYQWDLDYNGTTFTVDSTLASPTFSAASLDGPTTRSVALKVIDNSGATSSVSATTVNITNDPPRAGISGPSTVTAGEATTYFLTGTDASAADRDAILVYSIDWNGDGTTDETVSGVGEQRAIHTFTTPGSYNINVRATDKDGATGDWSTSPVTVIAANQAPVANADSYSTTAGTTLSVAAPGVLANDNDADANPITAVLVSGPANGALTLNANGSFSYTPAAGFSGSDGFTYKANDGSADSASASVTLSVAAATPPVQMQPDPSDPSKTSLVVTGTGGSDSIQIQAAKKGGQVQVFFGNQSQGTYSPTGSIIVDGGSGNDAITNTTGRTAIIYGGAGNDTLTGGSSRDALVGGDGDDVLFAGSGGSRDVLIGGNGADRLEGAQGEDILIGGASDFDANTAASQQALASLLDQWNAGGSYSSRVSAINPLLQPRVHEDGVADLLTGKQGNDWFFAHSGTAADTTDRAGSEIVTPV